MATRLTFIELDTKLKHGALIDAELRRYLEPDPTANVPRLRSKPGALADGPPPGYDVDEEVYLAKRAAEGRARALARKAKRKLCGWRDRSFKIPGRHWPPGSRVSCACHRSLDDSTLSRRGESRATFEWQPAC